MSGALTWQSSITITTSSSSMVPMDSESIQQCGPTPQSYRNEYRYRPLPVKPTRTIRILSLLPKDPLSDEVRFILHHRRLSHRPRDHHVFEALSYAWDSAYRQSLVYCYSPSTHCEISRGCCQDDANPDSSWFTPAEWQAAHKKEICDQCSEGPERSDTKAKMYVTANLLAALQHLQPLRGSRELWIDAICINQEDQAERSQQLHLIPDIFRMAKQVVAWIGEGRQSTDIAFEFMTQIAENARAVSVDSDVQPYMYIKPQWLKGANAELLSNADDLPGWRAALDIYTEKRTYWHRLWVVEELTLNNNAIVQCGPSTISWMDLAIASMILYQCVFIVKHEPYRHVQQDVFYVFQTHQLFRRGDSGLPLWWLMRTHSRRDCTKPQDRVLALLGLLEKTALDKLAHLTYAMSSEEILQQAVQTSFELEGYQLLRDVEFCPESRAFSLLPTWVVGCGDALDNLDPMKSWLGIDNRPDSCDISRTDMVLQYFHRMYRPEFDGPMMTCHCFIIDTITYASDSFTSANAPGQIFASMEEELNNPPDRSWAWSRGSHLGSHTPSENSGWNFLAALHITLGSPHETMHQLCKTKLQAFITWLSTLIMDSELFFSNVPRLCGQPSAPKDDRNPNREETELDGSERDWDKTISMRMFNLDTGHSRNLIKTRLGFPGIGPFGSSQDTRPTVQAGDVIAVFPACKSPIILRPTENQTYKLIGTCFLGGFEQGPWYNPGGLLSASANPDDFKDEVKEIRII